MSANKGNGLGGFNECWDRVKKNENIAGGFIEDFTDQTFYMKNKSGKLFFAYGGSFGETQSDSFLCVSGIMTSNKTPKPSSKVVSTVFNWFETKVIDIEKDNLTFIIIINLSRIRFLAIFGMYQKTEKL